MSWCLGVMVPGCHGVRVLWCEGIKVSMCQGVMLLYRSNKKPFWEK